MKVAGNRVRTFVTTITGLERCVTRLQAASRIGLDVETELFRPNLCLVQLAVEAETFMVDALAFSSLAPLQPVLESSRIVKVIHNASFERRILRHAGMGLDGVFDTLTASRRHRGFRIDGGHGLAVVCQRELGITLNKDCQCSNWRQRPLSPLQLSYAALDAEVLLPLHDRFTAQ